MAGRPGRKLASILPASMPAGTRQAVQPEEAGPDSSALFVHHLSLSDWPAFLAPHCCPNDPSPPPKGSCHARSGPDVFLASRAPPLGVRGLPGPLWPQLSFPASPPSTPRGRPAHLPCSPAGSGPRPWQLTVFLPEMLFSPGAQTNPRTCYRLRPLSPLVKFP